MGHATQIQSKIARLRGGQPPRVLDLFSGCGGLSLGLQRAGCVSIGGVEIDEDAARSYQWNFHPASPRHGIARDITKVDPAGLLRELGHELGDVDILVGGPPCPAFTRVGRAKLRQVHAHPQAFLLDPRARLYESYLDFVRALQPVALLMENVPDILNWGGQNVGDDISAELGAIGYRACYTLLNAVHYGVPQMRERFILVAVHESMAQVFRFPPPRCQHELPRGYESSRNVAMRLISEAGRESPYFQPTPERSSSTRLAVTVRQAIGDLPVIDVNGEAYRKRGARPVDRTVQCRPLKAGDDYLKSMRDWPGFSTEGTTTGHVTRCLTDRDHRIFARMPHGAEYPEAHRIALQLFEDKWRSRPVSRHVKEELMSEYVPPYDPGKYPNKWWKMIPDRPSRTLMAHLGKDGYSHIHYSQHRVLTVREAARLQSFPDGFRFAGCMNSAFRQIGNAVPPVLAYALGQALLRQLGCLSSLNRACRQEPVSPIGRAARQ